MDHVAIMRKEWGFLPKVITGEKRVESRWLKTKRAPWNRIRAGDAVYFKNSGEPVRSKVIVDKVLQYADLTPNRIRDILRSYGEKIGIEQDRLPFFLDSVQDKRYCVLIFLKDPAEVPPFNIEKSGFGMMAAWLTFPSIVAITKP